MDKRSNVYSNTLKLTQGSIINHCVASGVPLKSGVWGCVITPRCDLEHNKVSTIHYLPIIDFDLWATYFAKPQLYDEFLSDLSTQIYNSLKKIDVKENLIEAGYSYDDIVSVFNNCTLDNKQRKKAIDDVSTYFKSPETGFKKYIGDKKHKKYTERLINGDLHQYYLIEDWQDATKHKVVLLRDIRHIDMSIALKYQEGFFPKMLTSEQLLSNNLSATNEDLYCIETTIASPYIEHLLQAFVYNFNRIGIPDMPKDKVKLQLIDKISNII